MRAEDVPVWPGVLDLSRRGLKSGNVKRGRATLGDVVRIDGRLEETLVDVFFDEETSGGLLISIPAA